MANMSNNRINEVASPDQMKKAKENIHSLGKEFPFLVGLKVEERVSLQGIDVSNKAFVEDALKAARANPDMLPSYISVENAEMDLQLFEQMDEMIPIVQQFLEKLIDTRLLAGSEAYMTSLMLYRLFTAAAAAGIPGADTVVAQLQPRFAAQGARAPKPDSATM